MSARYALMLAASLGRSISPTAQAAFSNRLVQDGIMPDVSEEDFCGFVAELAEAFTQRLTADGNSLRDTLNAYDDLRGGILLYDAADTLWDIARRKYRYDAPAIAAEAFAALFPHAVR